jgi:glycosyltransferase involved in cell wall biosynthesis
MSEAPRVSVLMSVFNGERYLREAIDSILTQTFTDFEYLIINDGSSDTSRSIILSYNDSRIRLIDNDQNIGLTKSLNRGLAVAGGEFIARQDADDISLPERLAKQVAFMDANPHVALTGTWYQEVDANGTLLQRVRLPTDEMDLRWALLFYCPFVHSAVMLRREPLLETGEYCESYEYAQDHELWLRIGRRNALANLKAYLVKYRKNPDSMTAKYGEFSEEGMQLAVATIGTLLGWDAENRVENETVFRGMFDVLYGERVDRNLTEIRHFTSFTWELQKAFCRAYEVTPHQAKVHERKLHAWLAWRYSYLAGELLDNARVGEAWILFYKGCRESIRILYKIRTVVLLYKLLRGTLRGSRMQPDGV